MPEAPGVTPEGSGIAPVASGMTPVASGTTPVASGITPVASGTTPVASGITPVASGMTPVASGITPVASGMTPVASGVTPERSGLLPAPPPLAYNPATVLVQVLLGVYAAVLGLIVGSYLNVVVYRLPRGISTVLPRSRCPGCGAAIRARDNVPVLSFLLLGGRCRQCGAVISWRYPAIEALTGALFLGCYLRFGLSLTALVAALFCCLMVVLAAIDAEHMILPDRITLPGIAVGLALQPWIPWVGWRQALVGAALGGGLMLALYWGWYLLRREEGMGQGDIKMLAMIGAFLGWRGVLVTLFFGALIGAAVGLALLRRDGAGMKSKLPFGSFLALGGLIALFAGEPIAEAYLSLL